MVRKTAALAILLALAACTRGPSALSSSQTETAIINGKAVTAEEPIHKATVRILADGKKICSGILIKDDVVLTAAHCFDLSKLKADSITVHLPVSDDLTCALSKVADIQFPPDAVINSEGVHQPDLAIVKLTSKPCDAVPAKLSAHAAAIGDVVTTAGFGVGTNSSKFADRIDIKRVNSEWDSIEALYYDFDWNVRSDAAQLRKLRLMSENFAPTYHFAISENPEQSFCVGDSGGPVYKMINGEVNVVALNGAFLPNRKRGIRNCGMAFLQLMTPLEPQLPWISKAIEN